MRRSATIWGRFAAFCNDLGAFCSVLQRFGVVLWRSASIGGRFAVFCVNLETFCCVLKHPAPPAVRSRSISPVRGPSIAAPSFCMNFGVVLRSSATIWGLFCGVLQRFGGCRTPQKRAQIVEVRLRRLSFQPSGVLRSFCNALAPFCAVLQRFGVVFAAFCFN